MKHSEATLKAIESAQKSFGNYSQLAKDRLAQAKEQARSRIGEERADRFVDSASGFGRRLIAAGHQIGSSMTYENYASARDYSIDSANSLYNLVATHA